MNVNKKIFLLVIFIISISIAGAYCADIHHNSDLSTNISNQTDSGLTAIMSNETDSFGCCSIVLQLDGNESIMCYRRDSNYTADVFIEKVNWHGKPAIKQYKTDNKYFNHVIITNDGWIIGLGGIDDGIDSEICENITAKMITKDYSISEDYLTQIQEIKKKYGRGHVVIKAPNGNYGFATPTKLKTGTLNVGEYISIPNNYELSRRGYVSLDEPDKIGAMINLSRTDLYGDDRREIITYDVHLNGNNNTTDIYISNEDGSLIGKDYTGCVDNVIFNNTTIEGKDIPIAPNYKSLGSMSFEPNKINLSLTDLALLATGIVLFIALLFVLLLRLIRFIKTRSSRRSAPRRTRRETPRRTKKETPSRARRETPRKTIRESPRPNLRNARRRDTEEDRRRNDLRRNVLQNIVEDKRRSEPRRNVRRNTRNNRGRRRGQNRGRQQTKRPPTLYMKE